MLDVRLKLSAACQSSEMMASGNEGQAATPSATHVPLLSKNSYLDARLNWHQNMDARLNAFRSSAEPMLVNAALPIGGRKPTNRRCQSRNARYLGLIAVVEQTRRASGKGSVPQPLLDAFTLIVVGVRQDPTAVRAAHSLGRVEAPRPSRCLSDRTADRSPKFRRRRLRAVPVIHKRRASERPSVAGSIRHPAPARPGLVDELGLGRLGPCDANRRY
jgi:hypothetical protein